ncbi:MAG: fibronectin type III domain-containing protein [Gammaproteobacteria bacterium]
MKLARNVHQDRSFSTLKLFLLSFVVTQLVACGGGGSSSSATKKVPDAYRVSSESSSSATTVEASSNADNAKNGVLELSWSAPATRTDGEPLSLSDIDGYRLYYGKKKGEYVKGADIKDGAAQSATVTGVPLGKYYVVMTTYDTSGVESDYSQSVRKRVM